MGAHALSPFTCPKIQPLPLLSEKNLRKDQYVSELSARRNGSKKRNKEWGKVVEMCVHFTPPSLYMGTDVKL
jgi:hypothetical protein